MLISWLNSDQVSAEGLKLAVTGHLVQAVRHDPCLHKAFLNPQGSWEIPSNSILAVFSAPGSTRHQSCAPTGWSCPQPIPNEIAFQGSSTLAKICMVPRTKVLPYTAGYQLCWLQNSHKLHWTSECSKCWNTSAHPASIYASIHPYHSIHTFIFTFTFMYLLHLHVHYITLHYITYVMYIYSIHVHRVASLSLSPSRSL